MGTLLLFLGLLAAPSGQPPACGAHELVYHDKLSMVLLLNCGETADKGIVWGWNGRKWTEVSSDAPSPRELGGAVYDTRRNVVVMYGGLQVANSEPRPLAETWEWDGKTWKKIDAAPPDVTDHFAMAYDATRGKTVLYGGQGPDQKGKAATWTWDGIKWENAASAEPGVQEHHTMVFDSKRNKIELLGGAHQPEDLWEWNGSAWKKSEGRQPRARSHASLVYGSQKDQLMLFGGFAPRTWLGDTWVRAGDLWAKHEGQAPSARGLSAMAYDQKRDKIILYGGENSDLNGNGSDTKLSDTWEWDGKQWSLRTAAQ
jgi:hypothetical protein